MTGAQRRRDILGTAVMGLLAAVVAMVWPDLVGALGVGLGAAALRGRG